MASLYVPFLLEFSFSFSKTCLSCLGKGSYINDGVL
jgi:hypothetical protein